MTTCVIAGLTWEPCLPPASDAEVAGLEGRLGLLLPRDYVDVARTCHGGAPVERNSFVYRQSASGDWGSCLAQLLPLRPSDPNSIETTMEHLAVDDQLPERVIPIAGDGGGDFVCLDYRAGAAPTIVYWSHERDSNESTFFLADSFTAFLAALEPPEDLPDGWDE